MGEDGKKLVRGLKDISPLFAAVPEDVPVRRSPEIQILSVSSPDCDGDSLLLNTFFASQIAAADKTCSLVSVLSRCSKGLSSEGSGSSEPFGEHLRRYNLYWDELRDLLDASSDARAVGVLQSRDIFLDFEYRYLLHCERALCLLDKWVLLLKPNAESLTEGYKMMKAGHALNPQLEFYVALAGKADETKGAVIFDRFSAFTSKHLDVQPGWLGWMNMEDFSSHDSPDLHAEPLCYQSWDRKPNLQKFVLSGWIESMEKKSDPMAFAGVMR